MDPDQDNRPTVHLLSGLPGTGKSTWARAVESGGVLRLSVDDRLRARHGQAGVDYPMREHLARLEPVVAEVLLDVVRHLAAGRDVVLDHGLGRRAERDEVKLLVERHGGRWRLWAFHASREDLLRRLAARGGHDGFGPMDADLLDAVAAGSEEPDGEGEEVVQTDD